MSFLIVENLRKTYPDGTPAVKGVSLEINAGEFIVLLGPSGCGKTTTLRMLAGLETPTGGRVLLAGQDITQFRPGQRDVGFVFQFYALYPHLTVAQNIAFPLENRKFNKQDCRKKVQAIARHMGLESLLKLHPGQLSGGDQQRVALARAMVRQPRLYLMDEPLGTLDADLRLTLREYIREQQTESGVTTIYVTHDQEEAMALADRIVVMRAGEVCQVDVPEKVYEAPDDLFVAHFVGSPGMNIVEAILRKTDHHYEVVTPDGSARFTLPIVGNLQPASDRQTWGIRPEYLSIGEVGPVTGTVVLVERLGAFAYVYADTAWGRLAAMTGPDVGLSPGEIIRLTPDPAHLHWFDTSTGKRVDRL